jgi:NADH:ubiquinone oxidoreductase subunit 6 (subunit J)
VRWVKARVTALVIGVALILIALILGGLQDMHVANIYGGVENKWYFYAVVGAVLLVGIVFVVWGLLKREAPKQSSPQ